MLWIYLVMHKSQITKNIFVLFTFWFWFGVWAFGLGLILVGGLRWWSGDQLFLVRLCNYLMPWLLMGLLTVISISLLTNRYHLILLLVTPTLFLLITYAPLFLPGHERSNGGFQLNVMSYNVWRENLDIPGIAEVIRNQNRRFSSQIYLLLTRYRTSISKTGQLCSKQL